MIQNPTHLIWIDLEMTGLDTRRDQIIEIATVITTGSLDTVAEGPVIAIHQPESVIGAMDEWNTVTHGDSGLIKRIRESTYTHAEAERETKANSRPASARAARSTTPCASCWCTSSRVSAWAG